MFLFPLLSIPLWLLLLVSFYPQPTRGWKAILVPFCFGTLPGMFCLAITLSLLTRIPFGLNAAPLFLWNWIRGPGFPLTLGIVFAGIPGAGNNAFTSRIRETACRLSGAGFVYMVWNVLVPDTGAEQFQTLFYPLLWTGSLGLVSFALGTVLKLDGFMTAVFMVLLLFLPSLLTIIPMLYISGSILLSWILCVLLAVFPTLLIFFESRG